MKTSHLLIIWPLLLLMAFVSQHVKAANPDTLYVNHTSSYIVFDEAVEALDLGGNASEFADQLEDENVVYTDQFAAKFKGNAVYVKALTEDCTPTTLYVQAGREVFVGILCYKEVVDRPFYDQREKTLNKAASYNRENYVPEVDVTLIEERLYELENVKREVFDIAKTSNKLTFSLVNFRADATAIYVRLTLENNSGLVYRMSGLSAENVEYYKKGFFSKRKTNRIPVEEIIEGNAVDVPAYSSRDFYMALPTYAVGDQGAVLITVRESTGIRAMQLEVPGDLLQKSNLF